MLKKKNAAIHSEQLGQDLAKQLFQSDAFISDPNRIHRIHPFFSFHTLIKASLLDYQNFSGSNSF